MQEKIISDAVKLIQERAQIKPEIGMILGSGLGDYAEKIENPIYIPYSEIAGFPVSTVPGHKGRFVIGTCCGKNVIAMQGRVHYYEGYTQEEITLPIRIMNRLGVKKVLLTNAAGGCNASWNPGTLMIIRDHINYSGSNPLIGKNVEEDGPRFPDMTTVYDKEMISKLKKVTDENGIHMEEGVYMMFTGPSFETPAEVRMAQIVGADAVGMSTVPEAIVCAHCGIKVLGISCITNKAAGISEVPLSHEEVVETTNRVKDEFLKVVDLALKEVL